MSLFVYFQILESLESWQVWKVWKTCSCCCNPFGFTALFLVIAKENKDDRSAQTVQDEASLSPAAKERASRRPQDPKLAMRHASHSVAAMIRSTEVRRAVITRERFCWNDHTDTSEREWTFQRKYRLFRIRCAPGGTLIYCGGLWIFYLWGSLWVPKPEKMFKLSRGV